MAITTSSALAQAHEPELVWADDFETLDTSVWQPMIGDGTEYGIPGWGNNELQYYTDNERNAYVRNGELVIVAHRESQGGKEFTSARLRTLGAVDVQYGRIEARVKVPATTGIWPAFWMLPSEDTYGNWPLGGEIDILETKNDATALLGAIHFGDPWPNNTYAPGWHYHDGTLADNYFIYSIDWFPDRIEWRLNNTLYHRVFAAQWHTATAPDSLTAPFDQPFHLLLNVAVGGWPGPPDETSVFPQEMRVDYVRIYAMAEQRQAFDGAPASIPGTIEAERFDYGGEGVAYHDNTQDNLGGQLRPHEAVDIEANDQGGFNVGWIQPGEWLTYTTNIVTPNNDAARFDVVARASSARAKGGAFVLEIDGVDVSGDIAVPHTGDWQHWHEVRFPVSLRPGQHTLRLKNVGAEDTGFNLDRLEFTIATQTPQTP
ncbi:MAG: carbohydrate-binding protein [Planctomycetota bacterium]